MLRSVPVLVLAGDEDSVTPVVHSRAIAEALPDAELVVVPGAGHMVQLEAEQLVTRRLRELPRPGGARAPEACRRRALRDRLGRAGRGRAHLHRLPGARRHPYAGRGRLGAARARGCWSSARRRARRRTRAACRSSAAAGSCSTCCSPRSAVTGRRTAVLNTLKCRPPGNRAPTRTESANCRGWTERQLALRRAGPRRDARACRRRSGSSGRSRSVPCAARCTRSAGGGCSRPTTRARRSGPARRASRAGCCARTWRSPCG